jgi:hypothetical protein
MGVMSVANGAGPLGTLQMGSLAEWIGPQGAILRLSATGAALLIGAAILWPELRRRVD